ncbi:MAG TPA: hypothetical protein VL401_01450 [Alphaproteobacteria bacterium]|jgi:hypothetical protein|nr:hypothetical protein [Alphaproteobacteria bacterium]
METKHGEIPQTELIIRPQTSDEEYNRVSFYLRKLNWYSENGYKLDLPSHPIFQKLAERERIESDLNRLDLPETREIFQKEVYDINSYSDRLLAVESDRSTVEQAFSRFYELKSLWNFKVFSKYEIALTEFGTLGSYNEKEGKIIISTNQKWQPKKTIIHEGVHIGIEANIVQKYNLSHWEKERVVDLMCKNLFGDLLPEYTLQEKGDPRINPYVTETTLKNLPVAISEYVANFPRI